MGDELSNGEDDGLGLHIDVPQLARKTKTQNRDRYTRR
jgi:hypothetical protein